MDRKRVLEALEVLHSELNNSDQVSDDARASLGRVSDDIRQLLATGAATGHDDSEAASALKDALLEFEAEHPHLTQTLNQVAAALANLGI